jgi:hypothetical protein
MSEIMAGVEYIEGALGPRWAIPISGVVVMVCSSLTPGFRSGFTVKSPRMYVSHRIVAHSPPGEETTSKKLYSSRNIGDTLLALVGIDEYSRFPAGIRTVGLILPNRQRLRPARQIFSDHEEIGLDKFLGSCYKDDAGG